MATAEERQLEKSMTINAGVSNMKSKGRPVKLVKTIGKSELDSEMEKSLKRLELLKT